jgi:hypothetical protein
MSKVQKDSEDVFAGISIFKINKLLNKFFRNLRSKSARSTLTSPGPIRVKVIIYDSRLIIDSRLASNHLFEIIDFR